jgi:hypothetical protein
MSQFKTPKKTAFLGYADTLSLHSATTNPSMPSIPKWPPPYPPSWDKQAEEAAPHRFVLPLPSKQITLPSIPTIVGYIVISLCCGYTAYEALVLLLKAFPQAVK